MLKVPIDSIKFDKEFYPREHYDNATVNQYLAANLDAFPPIVVTKDMTLIDGYHRLTVFKSLVGREPKYGEIDVEVLDIPKDKILFAAIRLNAKHGKPLTSFEKQRNTEKLHDQGYGDQEIADVLSVSLRTIQDYLAAKKKQERDEKIERARELSQQKPRWSYEDIAKEIDVPLQTVSRWLAEDRKTEGNTQEAPPAPPAFQDEMKKLLDRYLHCSPVSDEELKKLETILKANITKFDHDYVPENLKVYNLWQFGKRGDKYGFDFPGAASCDLMENILYYYTRPFDIVVDPMAGSGTTHDACMSMSRRCLAYDINPVRDEIKQWDITKGYPPELREVWKPKLVFLDPPYSKKKRKEYGEESVSALDEKGFLDFMNKLAVDTFEILPLQGVVALLVQDCASFEDDAKSMFAADFYCQFKQAGFIPIDYVQTPLSTEQKSARDVEWAKQKRRLLEISRHLFVFRKY